MTRTGPLPALACGALIALGACAPLPGPAGDAGPAPRPDLVPLDAVLAASDALAAAAPAAGPLPARVAALEARAGGLGAAPAGPDAGDAARLAARLAALAARAAALRAGGLDPAERDRLSGAGASLP